VSVCHSSSADSNNSLVVFAHHSKWQNDMMEVIRMSHVSNWCMTVQYMTFLFCYHLTNAGYLNAATILLCNECQEWDAEWPTQIVGWNPDWKPQEFMTDFSDAQIAALQTTFEVTFVYLLQSLPLEIHIQPLFYRISLRNHLQRTSDSLHLLRNWKKWRNWWSHKWWLREAEGWVWLLSHRS